MNIERARERKSPEQKSFFPFLAKGSKQEQDSSRFVSFYLAHSKLAFLISSSEQ